ncbi:MAG: hypothetical protein J6M17_10455 [Ruminococcus sp.]|nr:hypothetical protein [Ruminococcus sp.]
MKLTVEGEPKEIAELVQGIQARQSDGKVKELVRIVFKKFCDDYDLHDEEIDKKLDLLVKE